MAQAFSRNSLLSVAVAFITILILSAPSLVLTQLASAGQRSAKDAVESAQLDTTSQVPPIHFASAVSYALGGYGATSVAIADVNGDGRPDLVVANNCDSPGCGSASNYNGAVSVLLGNGDGTFHAPVAYSSGGNLGNSVAIADVNGDGYPDLVVANEQCNGGGGCPGTVGLLLGKGDGTFNAPLTYPAGTFPVFVAIADVNADGHADLVVANLFRRSDEIGGGGVSVLLGNGDGTFQAPVTYSSGGGEATSVAIADVNHDGHPDLVVANRLQQGGVNYNGAAGVLLGNGDGTFQAPVTYRSSETNDITQWVAIADVNADGHPDLVVANYSPTFQYGALGVLLGNGDGTFRAPVSYSSGGLKATSVAIADVNGDGHPDLIVANASLSSSNYYIGSVSVLPGNGDGTFQAPLRYASGGHDADSVAIADLNADGRLDLVVANFFCANANCATGSVSVLLNNTPFCTTPPVVTLSATPTSLWPPNGKTVPVTVSGTITDTGCTVTTATYAVTDEYGQVQPSGPVAVGKGGAYSFTIPLQASRLGADLDGRLYTITVIASNNGGKTGSQVARVIVPHNQGH
jgi:hypothetical protein